jgi:hypothetical protein
VLLSKLVSKQIHDSRGSEAGRAGLLGVRSGVRRPSAMTQEIPHSEHWHWIQAPMRPRCRRFTDGNYDFEARECEVRVPFYPRTIP